MGYTDGGVKYRCEIGSAPSPSPPWQPACRSPSTASCARLESGRALPSTLSSSPCSTLHSLFPALFPPRSTPAPPRPSPSASQPGQEHQRRPALGGPGTATPEAQGSVLVPHPGGPRRSSSNCSRPPSPPPAAKDTAAPPGSRRRAPLPLRGGSRSSLPELPPRSPGEVSANCPAGRSPDPPSTGRAEPLVPASHSSTTQPRRRPPIFPLAGQGGHAAGRRERAGTALPRAGGEAASRGCAALSSAQLRSSPAAGCRLGAASRGRAGRGQRGRGARIRGAGAEGSAARLPGAPCSAAPQLSAPRLRC